MKQHLKARLLHIGGVVTLSLGTLCPVFATPVISSITPSKASPQPLGTTVVFTVAASDTDAGQLQYRLSTKGPGQAAYAITRDMHPSNTFEWTPSQVEGPYTILVSVVNLATNKAVSSSISFQATSRLTGTGPVANTSRHPLVALFSAPACPSGSTMSVTFQPVGLTGPIQTTNQKRCNGSTSMNFYLAPMYPNTQYQIFNTVTSSSGSGNGPTIFWTSGAIPSSITSITPGTTVVRPVTPDTSTQDGLILNNYLALGPTTRVPTVTDLAGQSMWYYPALPPQTSRFYTRSVSGGSMLIFMEDPTVTTPNTNFAASQIMREYDLAGNTLRETNVARVSQMMAGKYPSWNLCNWTTPTGCAAGQTATLDFHHDAIRLPNGWTAVLMTAEKVYTDGTQGSSSGNPVDVVGDMIAVLDVNWQLRWAYNGFVSDDVTRKAVLNETCTSNGPGCPPINFMPISNDWTHSNSLSYDAKDGNILMSQRHSDYVIKINYADGTGNANILWRLGLNGNFTMNSTDPYPWQSHQHHAGFDNPNGTLLSLFDNNNTRVATLGSGNSRGVVYDVNETTMTVTPVMLADLGNYSFAVGSAQRLSNGNYSFGSGIINFGGGGAQSIEVVPAATPYGTLDFTLGVTGSGSYRAYRLPNLYVGLMK